MLYQVQEGRNRQGQHVRLFHRRKINHCPRVILFVLGRRSYHIEIREYRRECVKIGSSQGEGNMMTLWKKETWRLSASSRKGRSPTSSGPPYRIRPNTEPTNGNRSCRSLLPFLTTATLLPAHDFAFLRNIVYKLL